MDSHFLDDYGDEYGLPQYTHDAILSSIRLVNFKCFKELDLRCAPMTLLCGLNGMGKSTVIQALLLLNASRGRGTLELKCGDVDLGSPRDVLFEGAEKDEISFELRWRGVEEPFRSRYYLSGGAIGERSPGTLTFVEQSRDASKWDEHEQWDGDEPMVAKVRRSPVTRPPVYVGAERLGPRRIYAHSDALRNAADVDATGEYTLSYLIANRDTTLARGDPRRGEAQGNTLFDVLEYWLQQVTPGARLGYDVVKDAGAVMAGFSFDRPGDMPTRRYRATNVGFGLFYVLPVLVGLLVPKGHLCLIENPEAHLHPRGQARIAELAVRAAIAGVQVIVETHSDHFLDGVRVAVREGLIAPEDTAIHYFEREGGKSVVVTPEIDADGRLSHWPAGFFDQHDDNLARLLAPKP